MNSEKTFLTSQDYLVSGESFSLQFHPELEMLVTHPQPSEAELPSYYESDEYISHTDSKSGLFSRLYQLVKSWSLKKKLSLINSLNDQKGDLLDIGAGTGDFLKTADLDGWNVSGVEPNKNARDLASKKGLQLIETIEAFQNKQFDVITMWHVLEHVPNLQETISLLEKMVRPGGKLIIAVPNYKSYDANYYGKHWAAFDLPRHLWHFSKTAIEKLFSKEFDLIEIKPMIFDSYYVSLLSEKYKTGNTFSLKAFFIGLKSNLKAKSSKEYSSHIYCFKKHN